MRIITPDPLLPISGGVGEPNAATQKRGELTARAMVFRNGETTIAVVGIDALGFPAVPGDRIRTLAPRLPSENILIGATRTHSAPDCSAFPLPSGGSTGDLNSMQSVCEKAAEAVNAAIDTLQPATLRISSDKAAARIAENFYAPQLSDRRMGVIQILVHGTNVCGLVT